MSFDLNKHMDGLVVSYENLSRESRTRNLELKKLITLEQIHLLAIGGTEMNDEAIGFKVKILAKDIEVMCESMWNPVISSGEKSEVLARLVGTGILLDFPEVEETNTLIPELKFECIVENQQVALKIESITEVSREGVQIAILTKSTLCFTDEQIQLRKKVIMDEIKIISEAMDKIS